MSDDQQSHNSSEAQNHSPDTKPTPPESYPLPSNGQSSADTHKFPEADSSEDEDAEDTTAFQIVTQRDGREVDPTRQTAIISKDNPGLRRALNNQAVGNKAETKIGEQREVILLIRGMVERVSVTENTSFVMGRYEMGATKDEEIDLTPYGALDRGVSRAHAKIHLENEQLYVTDLGSTNGTYLGGNRLTPNEPTMLRKGDELLLGRLAIQILFR